MSEITGRQLNKMWNLMKYKYAYLIFSACILIPGIISLLLFKLNLAIDFTGGSVFIYDTENIDKTEIKNNIYQIFENNNIKIENFIESENTIEIRTKPLEGDGNQQINTQIKEKYPQIIQKSFESIGPSVGAETTKNAFIALGWVSVGILFYIAYAFRDVPKPYSSFRFGVSAIVAMLHDALMLLGVFSILGKLFKIEIDSLFITAMLTVIGFSVHDSIVVFDRIRENLKKLPTSLSFDYVVNYSVVETLNRSFATSLTVLMTLLSLIVLGGESIKYFVLALLIGIISGTYSSIFTASPLLVIWEEFNARRQSK